MASSKLKKRTSRIQLSLTNGQQCGRHIHSIKSLWFPTAQSVKLLELLISKQFHLRVWGPLQHDDVIKWMNFPRYWPSVRRIHRSSVNSPHKGQWRGALIFSLICAWINSWVNDGEAGDLRRHRVHYDVIVMKWVFHSRHTLTQASFAHNVISNCPIVLKFYTGDGSRTAVLCAKFEMITQMKPMLWARWGMSFLFRRKLQCITGLIMFYIFFEMLNIFRYF